MRAAEIPLILPAAGKSSRLGSPKGLRQVNGRPWLEIQCESFHAAGGSSVVLVLGYDRAAYLSALEADGTGLPATRQVGNCRVIILVNPLPEFGPFSSLQTAARWLIRATACPAAFYLPIDTPVPAPEICQALRNALASGMSVVEPRYRATGGHPLLLCRGYLQELAAVNVLDDSARLDAQVRIARSLGRVAGVAVEDECVTLNLNDAAAWLQYSKTQ